MTTQSTPCATINGEAAYCPGHAASMLEIPKQHLYAWGHQGRVHIERPDMPMSCGRAVKAIRMGELLMLIDQGWVR